MDISALSRATGMPDGPSLPADLFSLGATGAGSSDVRPSGGVLVSQTVSGPRNSYGQPSDHRVDADVWEAAGYAGLAAGTNLVVTNEQDGIRFFAGKTRDGRVFTGMQNPDGSGTYQFRHDWQRQTFGPGTQLQSLAGPSSRAATVHPNDRIQDPDRRRETVYTAAGPVEAYPDRSTGEVFATPYADDDTKLPVTVAQSDANRRRAVETHVAEEQRRFEALHPAPEPVAPWPNWTPETVAAGQRIVDEALAQDAAIEARRLDGHLDRVERETLGGLPVDPLAGFVPGGKPRPALAQAHGGFVQALQGGLAEAAPPGVKPDADWTRVLGSDLPSGQAALGAYWNAKETLRVYAQALDLYRRGDARITDEVLAQVHRMAEQSVLVAQGKANETSLQTLEMSVATARILKDMGLGAATGRHPLLGVAVGVIQAAATQGGAAGGGITQGQANAENGRTATVLGAGLIPGLLPGATTVAGAATRAGTAAVLEGSANVGIDALQALADGNPPPGVREAAVSFLAGAVPGLVGHGLNQAVDLSRYLRGVGKLTGPELARVVGGASPAEIAALRRTDPRLADAIEARARQLAREGDPAGRTIEQAFRNARNAPVGGTAPATVPGGASPPPQSPSRPPESPSDTVARQLDLPEVQRAVQASDAGMPEAKRAGWERMLQGEISNIDVPEQRDANFSTSPVRDEYLGDVARFQKNYPVSTEVMRYLDARSSEVVDLMREETLTMPEALARLGKIPATPGSADPALVNRFITHPTAYTTGGAYADFAEQTAAVATELYRKGVPSEAVSKFVAEAKQQFQLLHAPDNRVTQFNRRHGQTMNPTVFVREANATAGGHPNYEIAARAILDTMERHADRVQVVPIPGRETQTNEMNVLSRIIALEARGAFRPGAASEALSPQEIAEMKARLFSGTYDESILDGRVVRLPIDTPHGVGGALYVAEVRHDSELVTLPQTLRDGTTVTRTVAVDREDPAYSLEVILDQGTGDTARNGLASRYMTTWHSHRAMDDLLRGATGQASADQLRELAGVYYDLNSTSGNWTGGGAGTNHILLASAFERLTGQVMPGLTGPADLYAATMTREEFQQFFMSGALFRNGGDALRSAGVEPGPPVPFQVPRFAG